MKTIIIQPKTKSEEKFLMELFKKMSVPSKAFAAEQIEEIGLGLLMKQADRSKKVSRQSILKKLG